MSTDTKTVIEGAILEDARRVMRDAVLYDAGTCLGMGGYPTDFGGMEGLVQAITVYEWLDEPGWPEGPRPREMDDDQLRVLRGVAESEADRRRSQENDQAAHGRGPFGREAASYAKARRKRAERVIAWLDGLGIVA